MDLSRPVFWADAVAVTAPVAARNDRYGSPMARPPRIAMPDVVDLRK
jgi:hypothetical protein